MNRCQEGDMNRCQEGDMIRCQEEVYEYMSGLGTWIDVRGGGGNMNYNPICNNCERKYVYCQASINIIPPFG